MNREIEGPEVEEETNILKPIGGKRVEETSRCRWIDHNLLV